MLRLLALSWFGLVYLTITAHCTVVKRSASTCTATLADKYCKMHIESSRNPSGKCVGGAIVCYMTSPGCRNAAGCEDVCGPLGGMGMSVHPQCVRNQCRCNVTEDKCTNAADCEDACGQLGDIGIPLQPQCVNSECQCEVTEGCTESYCKATCVKEFPGKHIVSSQCMPNQTCLCNYVDPCTGRDDCKSICKKRYPGQQFTSTRCLSDGTCSCEYVEPCRGEADCMPVCAKKFPGKRMLSARCMGDEQCLCEYSTGSAGSAGTLRPSELIMALILLTTLVKISAPAQGKIWTLLISPAMFGLLISQLAWV